jgi:putative ABC transport system permease protein
MRDTPLPQGRWFNAGQREVVVGKSISARYLDAAIGHRLNFGRGSWLVVGVMDDSDSALNSEIWGDRQSDELRLQSRNLAQLHPGAD